MGDYVLSFIDSASRIGWPSAVFAALVLLSFFVWRAYKREQRDLDEYRKLLDVYDKAVGLGDLDHAASVAVRLRRLRKKLGMPEPFP